MDKALVTGAGGFLGLYIVEQLIAAGATVRALSRRRSPALDALGVETVQADLRDRQSVINACEGIGVVYHAAGVAGIWGPWDHYYGINTLGTRHVIEGCLTHNVRKLVYTSSPSVTFDATDQCGIDESAPYPTRWLCHYPHTKALAEQEVLAANGKSGLLTCALRPHLIWGPRDQHLIPRLLARARSGRLRRVGDGRNLIDMVYVENAAAAHLQAAEALRPGSVVAGRAYFISQGEPVNCWQWINQILELAALSPVRRALSTRAAWGVGAAFEAVYSLLRLRREPPMTRFLAAQLGMSHYFDISRARRDFGYQPPVSTAEGMRRLEAWLRPDALPCEAVAPPGAGPQLLLHGLRMRAAIIVIAPVGRGSELPAAGDVPAILDQAVPGLSRVLTSHAARVKLWPPQLSVKGFAQAFFAHFRLPGDRGRGTPWCSLAGKFEANGRPLLLGLILSAAGPNGLSQTVAEHGGEWTRLLEIRDPR
jgi:nucleoside-diphosphate-sugar epimerase